jgi:transcriptional regulator with XRE-family HTH domain
MPMSTPEAETITTFGGYLRFLRRRARLTQTELGIAVGYSPGQISMLENGQRWPNPTAIVALFVPALGLEQDDPRRQRLIALVEKATPAHSRGVAQVVVTEAALITREEIRCSSSRHGFRASGAWCYAAWAAWARARWQHS